MKLRAIVSSAVIAGFLSAVPIAVQAQGPGWGDYDAQHQWHSGPWWYEHHPDWVQAHHPDWAGYGDYDSHHHWHSKAWWKEHHPNWAHQHHSDWF
jgi:hypothetical protein